MSEFEDRINSVLNDPEQMDKIANLAKSLMGGEGQRADTGDGGMMGKLGELAKGLSGGGSAAQESPAIDPAMLGKIGRLMKAGNAQNSNERALLEAMKPYLTEKRRQKMDRALQLAKLARIARIAMGEMGEGDV
ncbi:MAG: hypothetical protein SPE18_12450 [Candidatus Limivicinus sp.]|nr:hypothetical protein [Candidatus Limivicinus sp.]